jgi:thioredoxin 1
MAQLYEAEAVSRSDIDSMSGPVVLSFGTNWCGHCQAAEPAVEEALGDAKSVQHIKVEDGKGRALGRSFHVKLWPTLIFLKDGVEVDRLVRPTSVNEIRDGLKRIS